MTDFLRTATHRGGHAVAFHVGAYFSTGGTTGAVVRRACVRVPADGWSVMKFPLSV